MLATATVVESELDATRPWLAATVPSAATAAAKFATAGFIATSACFLFKLSACSFCSFLTGSWAMETARCNMV